MYIQISLIAVMVEFVVSLTPFPSLAYDEASVIRLVNLFNTTRIFIHVFRCLSSKVIEDSSLRKSVDLVIHFAEYSPVVHTRTLMFSHV